jgi:hypothetical protein
MTSLRSRHHVRNDFELGSQLDATARVIRRSRDQLFSLFPQVSRRPSKEKSDVKEIVRSSIVPGVRYSCSRRANEFPAVDNQPPDNQPLGNKSIGCVGRHPLQGCQRSREIEERDVGLQQHDGIVRQHRAVEQPRDKLEHELYLEHAGLNERSGKSPALLVRHEFQ